MPYQFNTPSNLTETMPASNQRSKESTACALRHFQFGWWSLLCFLTLGIVLEAFHAFKVGWYLEAANETRRLMWTLGHAHGTLLSLVHVAFGVTVFLVPETIANRRRFASPCLIGASFLLPIGFWLGGIFIYAGDPGVGIFLVPLGAVLLFAGVLLTATGVALSRVPGEDNGSNASST